MQGADQQVRSSLGFSILPKNTSKPQTMEIEPVTFREQDADSTPDPQPPKFHISDL